MTNSPELAPEVRRQAEMLAEVAIRNPAELKDKIAEKTIADLHVLADAIEQMREHVPDEASRAVLERIEQLTQSKTFDEKLALLQNRESLLTLADIRAPKPERSFIDTAKRQFFTVLSYIESMPTGLMSFVPGLSAVSSITSFMPSFGRRKLAAMDIQDAIDAEKRLVETINFSGLSAAEFTSYDTFVKEAAAKGETPPSLAELVHRYLVTIRERNERAGTPRAVINVTMHDLLKNPVAEEVAVQREESQEEGIRTSLGLSRVEKVELSDIASFEDGVLKLPSSEVEGTTLKPRSRAAVMAEALKEIPNANKLVVVPEGATKVEWEGEEKRIITVSLTNRVDDLSVLNSLSREKPEFISTISIASNDQMGRTKIRLGYENGRGVLSAPNQSELLTALSIHLQTLTIVQNEGIESQTFIYKNGDFISQDIVEINPA